MRQPMAAPIPRPQEPVVVPPVNISSAATATSQVNVTDLLNQLVTAGIIGGSSAAATNAEAADKKPTGSSILNPTVVREEIPKLSFKQTDQLKQ